MIMIKIVKKIYFLDPMIKKKKFSLKNKLIRKLKIIKQKVKVKIPEGGEEEEEKRKDKKNKKKI